MLGFSLHSETLRNVVLSFGSVRRSRTLIVVSHESLGRCVRAVVSIHYSCLTFMCRGRRKQEIKTIPSSQLTDVVCVCVWVETKI